MGGIRASNLYVDKIVCYKREANYLPCVNERKSTRQTKIIMPHIIERPGQVGLRRHRHKHGQNQLSVQSCCSGLRGDPKVCKLCLFCVTTQLEGCSCIERMLRLSGALADGQGHKLIASVPLAAANPDNKTIIHCCWGLTFEFELLGSGNETTEAVAPRLLHRGCCAEAVAPRLLHRGCCTEAVAPRLKKHMRVMYSAISQKNTALA